MKISSRYVAVERLEEVKKEGFQTVEVQDNFVYKGKIVLRPDVPLYVDNHPLSIGDVVIFAKYSPDTHEVEHEGKKYKFIRADDILAVL